MNIKAKGRVAGVALLCTAFIATNAYPSVAPAATSGEIATVTLAEDDPLRTLATENALLHLEQFLDHVLDERGNLQGDAAIKVALPGNGTSEEAVWLSPFARLDGQMIGVLTNEPRPGHPHHVGDVITFNVSQVCDWHFFGADGKLYGSYTTRALLNLLEPARAAQIQATLSENPIPAQW